MEKIVNIIVYIDDLSIHSQTHEQHQAKFDVVMTSLSEKNIKIDLANYFFGNSEISYLGFRLTPNCIKPCKDKLKAVETAKIYSAKEETLFFVHTSKNLQESVNL